MGNKIKLGILALLTVFLGIVLLGCMIKEIINCKKYGEPKYEFVIAEKYKHIGNEYHFFGGRGTKEEYHVVYKYRILNRPENEANEQWLESETKVDYLRYRSLKVGQRFEGSTPDLSF